MTLEEWRAMPPPRSHWRYLARRAIREVINVYGEALEGQPELLVAVDAAYPFGEREHHPYKAWLAERRLLIAALETPTMPTKDEVAVCEVARDLVELGRFDEARALIDAQAPNRLARKCPACAQRPGQPCVEPYDDTPRGGLYGWREMPVPHHARLVGHLDAGPLFRGAP